MPQRMGEEFIEPRLPQRAAGDLVRLFARHARSELLFDELVRFQHLCVGAFEVFVLFIVAEEEGARDIRTVPFHLAAEVDEDGVAESELHIPRLVMGHARARPEGADGLERGAARAEFSHVVFKERRDFRFRHALFDLGQRREEPVFCDRARPLDEGELLFRLKEHRVL